MVDFLNKKKKDGENIYTSLDWVDDLPKETKDYVNKITGKDEAFNTEYSNALKDEKYQSIIEGYGKKRGGEIHKDLVAMYKNFINGMYDDTPHYKEGKEVYDKLNRVYYNKAKANGMSSPNYIMSRIIN
ncbi:MAG: hypothetical protein CM15mV42_0760 [uncultured marine virus]|nr:MAG: hypothetical protein CM15mV42_0760 [uncultured marine virus]